MPQWKYFLSKSPRNTPERLMTLHWHHAVFSSYFRFLYQNRIENGFLQINEWLFIARQRIKCYLRTRNTMIQGFSIRHEKTTRYLICITVEKYVYLFRCLLIAKPYSHEVPTPLNLSCKSKHADIQNQCKTLPISSTLCSGRQRRREF